MNREFLNKIEKRRSQYVLSKKSTITNEELKEIVAGAVKHTPSAFNSQTTRIGLLLNEQSDKLWSLTKETLRKVVPADQFSTTEERITLFTGGYGTVLYFEDNEIIETLQSQFELYKDNFPIWAQQSNGMAQFIIWNTLEAQGMGANLQHYNELIEEEVKQTWNLPSKWKLVAQMPFGVPIVQPNEKEFKPVEDRIRVFE